MKSDEFIIDLIKAVLLAVGLYGFWRIRMFFSSVNDLNDVILLLACVIAGGSYWIGKCIVRSRCENFKSKSTTRD